MTKQKIFLNLTNGIEAIDKFGIDINDINFIRIQSTHCENACFDKLLTNLDSNFLMWLALGYDCIIYDFGAKCITSKAMYYGVEWIKFVLNKRWFEKEEIPFIKGKNVTKQFNEHYDKLERNTKRQIDYYKKFLLTEKLNIKVITDATTIDNKKDEHFAIIKKYFNN